MTTSLLGGPSVARRQRPRVEHRPPWASEASADEAIELAESVGLVLDPWQQMVVRAALAERSDGSWAASEVGVLVARQNGKGAALEAIVMHGLFLVEDPLTLWTAHQFKTSDEAFLRIKGWIDGSDDLRRLVKRMTSGATGEHGIELSSGPRLRFVARSKSSGRGFSPQRVIFDEAQELSTLAVAAMLFSTSAQANRQVIYAGTVPGPENNSEQWTAVRDRGRAGKSERLAWLEWSPKGSDDPAAARVLDLDDRRHWSSSNPARGHRITDETIAGERESLEATPEVFARERLSVWPSLTDGTGLIPAASWQACGSDPVPVDFPRVLAVETSFDRSVSSLVVVGTRPDGLPQVEVVEHRGGTDWVPARVAEIASRREFGAVVLGERSPAGSLTGPIDIALDVAGVDLVVTATSPADLAQGSVEFFDAVRDGTVRHLRDPLLDAAVRGAVQRPLGDAGWTFGRRAGGPSATTLLGAASALRAWRVLTVEGSYDPLNNIW